MALAIRLPRNPAVLRTSGPYPRALNVFDGQQTAVQRQLRRSGLAGYEPLTQATLLAVAQRAPADSAFYDIGAHMGLYSALIAAITGKRGPAVHAFEPSPGTADLARRIRDANGLHYQVLQRAVGAEPGEAELYFSLKAESSDSLNPGHRAHEESVGVAVTTVDEFTAAQRCTPRLIKIDVETLEADVLAGALETIRTARPWIVCELLPGSDHRALRAVLAEILAMDYHFHPIQPETPWPRRTAEDYQELVNPQSRDWLLAPRKVGGGWYRDMRQWLIAILACDERTSVNTGTRTALPRRWDAAYRSPYHLPARARSRLARSRLARTPLGGAVRRLRR